MKKTFTLFKTLLVAVGLCGGVSVGGATYTTAYNKAVSADTEAGISAWDAEADLSATEWVVNNAESNMTLSVNATKGLLFSIGQGNTGSNYATKTFSAIPSDGTVQYEVTWRTVRQYGKNGNGNKTYSYIQFGDRFRLSTGFNYYGDQPLYVNYDGTSSTVSQVMSTIKSDTNHNIVVKINCKTKEILLFTVDGKDYTANINTTLTGAVFNTLTIGSNKGTGNSWDIDMCSLVSAKVSYLANGISTWNFLDTGVWGNYTRDGAGANYKVSATGQEVWFAPDGSTATSQTSNVSFKFESDQARFNYGGTKGLGLAKNYDSANDINYAKVVVPVRSQVLVDVNTGSVGRPIVFNLDGNIVGTYKNSGTYSYTNEGETAATLKIYGTNVKDDYSTNTIRKITLIDTDNTDNYNYVVNATDAEGNVLKQLASGTALPYNAYSITGVPYVIVDGVNYYELTDAAAVANMSKSFTMGEANAVSTVSYTLNPDIVFFQEYESLSANGGRINGSASTSASNGNGAYIGYTSQTTITNATSNPISTTGVYEVMVRACDRQGKTQTKMLYLTDGTTDTEIGTLKSSNSNTSWSTTTLSNVTITSGQKFKLLTGSANSNDTYVGDYILVKKSKLSAIITTAGWATLYTDYALDFSSLSDDLTAYTATTDGSTVTLTEVQNVPAGTGVVLKGTAKEYSIPMAASSTADRGSLEGSTTEATAYNAVAGKDLYMLALNAQDEAQFTKVTSGSIAAGKAYLPIATGNGSKLRVVFAGDDATAIQRVESEKAENGAMYNLAGQRVGTDYKGIVIVNGKKFMNK